MSPESGASPPPVRVRLLLPDALRELNGGNPTIELEGATVRDALGSLRATAPAVHERLITERGEVRPHIHLFVGSEEIRHTGGLGTPLRPGDAIVVLRAVSGG